MNQSHSVDVGEVTATAWALMRADHTRDPREVGSSQIGRCIGELGYLLSGTEFTDPDAVEAATRRVGKDALIGIAIHAAILPYVASAWKALGAIDADDEIEVDATFDGVRLVGHADLAAETTPGVVDIVDLKTVSENAWLERRNVRGPKTDHLLQGADYCARYESQHPDKRVRNLTIWYVNRNRDTTDLHYTVPYRGAAVPGAAGNDMADWISDRHRMLAQAVADPDKVKKEYKYCESCGFQTRCLGKPVRCEDPAAVVRDDRIAEILTEAKQHRTTASIADKRHKEYKKLLDDLAPADATYLGADGIEHDLKWKNGGESIDKDAVMSWFVDKHPDHELVTQFLNANGGRLPKKPRSGSWSY